MGQVAHGHKSCSAFLVGRSCFVGRIVNCQNIGLPLGFVVVDFAFHPFDSAGRPFDFAFRPFDSSGSFHHLGPVDPSFGSVAVVEPGCSLADSDCSSYYFAARLVGSGTLADFAGFVAADSAASYYSDFAAFDCCTCLVGCHSPLGLVGPLGPVGRIGPAGLPAAFDLAAAGWAAADYTAATARLADYCSCCTAYCLDFSGFLVDKNCS